MPSPPRPSAAIWLFALGYFACYTPYSALAKALSEGRLPGGAAPVSGFELLPLSVAASILGMVLTITALGWWSAASRLDLDRLRLPVPRPLTALSGLCTAAIVATTTLSYTFEGASIVFMMLLMRGGVLVIAPLIDLLTGRPVRLRSGLALLLSLAGLLVGFAERGRLTLGLVAALDVAVYLLAYFLRLRLMSSQAKSQDPLASRRFFVEEQIVATPAVLLFLGLVAAFGEGRLARELHAGFTTILDRPPEVVLAVVLVGLFSQGTGVFGGLILLDPRENSFCVPVNRSSSILAGLLASLLLAAILGLPMPGAGELIGAVFVLLAILALSLPVPARGPAR